MSVIETILSRLCNKLLSPVDFTALFQALLISYFSNPDNIIEENLKQYTYRPDDSTGIIIEAAGRYNPEKGDHRPAILISREDWKVLPPGLGQGLIQGDPNKEVYVRTYSGAHNIICIGKTVAAADLLAGEVLHFLVQVLPEIRKVLPLSHLDVNGMSKPTPVGEGRTHFAVAIPVVYTFDVRWEIQITTTTLPPA